MISEILILIGSIFFLIAALGLLRLPDPYARLHAGTKAASLGSLLLLAAAALRFHNPWSLVLIGTTLLLVFVTAPLGSHAIARRLMACEKERSQDAEADDR